MKMITNKISNHYVTSEEKVAAHKTTVHQIGLKRSFAGLQSISDQYSKPSDAGVKNQRDFHRPELHKSDNAVLVAGKIINVTQKFQSDYSQRLKLALTPTPLQDPKLDLAHSVYGLPERLVQNLASLGINSIYPWQSECLLKSGALEGNRNLVYSAPTGGGKSLVADVLMLKKIIENPGKKALLVLPYVALVQEKTRWLRKVIEGTSKIVNTGGSKKHKQSLWQSNRDEKLVKVIGFFGGSRSKEICSDYDIAVCTIEKANALVNAAIEENSSKLPAIVVMDELHMIDDEHRGYILELMASKVLSLNEDVQLIGMSATLRNPQLLAKWLRARFYISQYKPIPIEEHLVFENAIYPASTSSMFYKTAAQLHNSACSQKPSQATPSPCRIIQPSESKEFKNPLVNSVVSLANETARAGYGALVFCGSRLGCERNARLISLVMPLSTEVDHIIMEKRNDLLNNLRSTSVGLDHILAKTVPRGVAFHHAGLTIEERELIATAYDQGILKVLVATCSLAAGINLPARRVILHGARMGADLIGPSLLRQMKGRAGRKGKDEIGESYLCCQKSDIEAVAELMEADLPKIESCLVPGKKGIKRALLEIVSVKLATSKETIDEYMNNTLACHSINPSEIRNMVESSLQELSSCDLIRRINENAYTSTKLGKAIVASCLTPEDGLFIYNELQKALKAFVMNEDMHALYIFTPIQAAQAKINWKIFREEVENLSESNLRVLEFVGLKLATINKMAQGGTMKASTPQEIETARIYRRFYTALQLRDLCNEIPIYSVARKYEIPRGNVQNLAQTCHGFAAGMIKFCEHMEWGALGAVLEHYRDRLRAGAKCDLLALAEVKYIKSKTARVFWENNYKSVGALAAADIPEILSILLLAQPGKLRTSAADEIKFKNKLRTKAEIISASANKIWERQMQEELEIEDEDL